MIWAFILLVALGFTFIKIGSYSVWVYVLSFGLKLFTGLFLIISGIFIWNKFLKPIFVNKSANYASTKSIRKIDLF
jgi:hypothetical protein